MTMLAGIVRYRKGIDMLLMNEVLENAIVAICITYIVWWVLKTCRRLKR